MWVGTIQSLEGSNRTKPCKKVEFSLSLCLIVELGHQSPPALRLGLTPLVPLVLRSLDSEWITPLAFLGLQLADGKSWDCSASRRNCVSQFLILYYSPQPLLTHSCLLLFLWRIRIRPVWERFSTHLSVVFLSSTVRTAVLIQTVHPQITSTDRFWSFTFASYSSFGSENSAVVLREKVFLHLPLFLSRTQMWIITKPKQIDFYKS